MNHVRLAALIGCMLLLTSPVYAGERLAQEPFSIDGFVPSPAERTPWTRFLNTFDFRAGACDPDFYRGSGFVLARPSHYRRTVEGRFGLAHRLCTIEKLRTQMSFRMGRNCPVYQGTIEMFLRSAAEKSIWSDGVERHIMHLYGPIAAAGPIADAAERDRLGISLVKTTANTLVLDFQGQVLELPCAELPAGEWQHIAVSWDSRSAPGRLWFTVNGRGVTAEARRPLQRLEYVAMVLGNSPREREQVYAPNFGDWPDRWARLTTDKPDDRDVYPLEAYIDELHISETTLADRGARALADDSLIDLSLYQWTEDQARLLFFHHWINWMPLKSYLGNKYGRMTDPGRDFARLHEIYGDVWFRQRAERFARIALLAQGPAGNFPTRVEFVPSDRRADQLLDDEIGLVAARFAGGEEAEKYVRIQDGFQNGPLSYLIYLYRLTGKQEYLDAARKTADLLVAAQNPNGSWSGAYDIATGKGHIADNPKALQGGEFDDGAISNTFRSLLEMYHVTKDERYLKPLQRCADWVLSAELVTPKIRGWASFYDAENRPVWARSHEPPKWAARVFPAVVAPLMTDMYFLTGDRKYLEGIRPALDWYRANRQSRGWPFFLNDDGTPYVAEAWTTDTWYGPEYGHFRDITDVERTIRELDAGTLRPPTPVTYKPTPERIARLKATARERLSNPEFMRRVKRDVALIASMEWVPNRPRFEPDIYSIQVGGSIDTEGLLLFLESVRVLTDRIPPDVACTIGVDWPIDDLYATPLRKAQESTVASGE